MLQRIQTIYLLLVVILSSVTLFLPLVELINTTENLVYSLNYKGVYLIQESQSVFQSHIWGVVVIGALIPLLAFITIFLYKNRKMQLLLCYINISVMIFFCVTLFIYVTSISTRLYADYSFSIVSALPFINIILSLLAIQAIKKDDKLVKSLDRIR